MNKKIIAAVSGLTFLDTLQQDWFLVSAAGVPNHRRMRSRYRITTDILTIISRK